MFTVTLSESTLSGEDGLEDVNNNARPGRPNTLVTDANVQV